MTIDEWLQALTHLVELIAKLQHKTETEIHRLGRHARAIVLDHEAPLSVMEEDGKDEHED